MSPPPSGKQAALKQAALRQAALEEAGDRLGAEFRLGGRTGAWTRTRLRGRVGCGIALAVAALTTCWIPFAVTGAPGRLTAGGTWGGLLIIAILMCAIPPRGWADQLFRFEHGLVLANPQEPESAVMRWDDLDSVRMTVKSGYDDDYISSCELRGRSGRSMTLDGSFPGVLTEIAASPWTASRTTSSPGT